jgi:hypothetical protein
VERRSFETCQSAAEQNRKNPNKRQYICSRVATVGQAGTHNLCSIPMNCFTCQFDRPVHATAITRDLSHL